MHLADAFIQSYSGYTFLFYQYMCNLYILSVICTETMLLNPSFTVSLL